MVDDGVMADLIEVCRKHGIPVLYAAVVDDATANKIKPFTFVVTSKLSPKAEGIGEFLKHSHAVGMDILGDRVASPPLKLVPECVPDENLGSNHGPGDGVCSRRSNRTASNERPT